jgi:hypothetical protein
MGQKPMSLSVTINYYGKIGYMLPNFGTYASRHVNHNAAVVRDDVEVDRRQCVNHLIHRCLGKICIFGLWKGTTDHSARAFGASSIHCSVYGEVYSKRTTDILLSSANQFILANQLWGDIRKV